jgi:hypothetical protein
MSADPRNDQEAADSARRCAATTWAALLAHWTSFARAAVALRDDANGERWRASVPAVIGLQAVTLALGDLDMLASGLAGEYAVGVDRAAILIREHAATLNAAWRSAPMPHGLIELMEDARAALEVARGAGTEVVAPREMIAPDPAMLASRLRDLGFAGECFTVKGGTPCGAGIPLAFVRGHKGEPAGPELLQAMGDCYPGCTIGRAPMMRQVYRSRDASGVLADIVAPLTDTLPAGRPMLEPLTL